MTQREWLCLEWEGSLADKVEGRNESPEHSKGWGNSEPSERCGCCLIQQLRNEHLREMKHLIN